MRVLDNDILYKSAISSLLIIFGAVILNIITTLEKNLNLNNISDNKLHFGLLILGALMFMTGWVNMANATSIDRGAIETTALYYASLAIMFSASAIKYMVYSKQIIRPLIPLFNIIIMISWLTLGILVGGFKITDIIDIISGNYNLSKITLNTNYILGLIVGSLVISGMILPWERYRYIADGTNMPIFVIVLSILVYININREMEILDNQIPKNNFLFNEKQLEPTIDEKQLESIFNTIVDEKHVHKASQQKFNAS